MYESRYDASITLFLDNLSCSALLLMSVVLPPNLFLMHVIQLNFVDRRWPCVRGILSCVKLCILLKVVDIFHILPEASSSRNLCPLFEIHEYHPLPPK